MTDEPGSVCLDFSFFFFHWRCSLSVFHLLCFLYTSPWFFLACYCETHEIILSVYLFLELLFLQSYLWLQAASVTFQAHYIVVILNFLCSTLLGIILPSIFVISFVTWVSWLYFRLILCSIKLSPIFQGKGEKKISETLYVKKKSSLPSYLIAIKLYFGK